MDKAPDAYRTISEVGEDLDIAQHVLRFWETRFPQIKPLKRGGGRRYYRPDDVELLKGIRHLLYKEGYTIKGVQRILKEQGPRAVQAFASPSEPEIWQVPLREQEPIREQIPEPVRADFSKAAPPEVLPQTLLTPPIIAPMRSHGNLDEAGPLFASTAPSEAIVSPRIEPFLGYPELKQNPLPGFAEPPASGQVPMSGQVSMFRGGVHAAPSPLLADQQPVIRAALPSGAESMQRGPSLEGGADAAFDPQEMLVHALEELEASKLIISAALARRAMA